MAIACVKGLGGSGRGFAYPTGLNKRSGNGQRGGSGRQDTAPSVSIPFVNPCAPTRRRRHAPQAYQWPLSWMNSSATLVSTGVVESACAISKALLYVHPATHLNSETLKMEMMVFTASALLGAAVCTLLTVAWRRLEETRVRSSTPPPRWMLGVDITGSQYLERPVCKAAATYAARAHAGAFRKSGQPYVMHCIETAIITEQIIKLHFSSNDIGNKRAETAIVTALLHDVVDDTSESLEDIRHHFGAEIAQLVKSVGQLSRNNQIMRRRYRELVPAGQGQQAAAEVDLMKAMIIQMTDEPLVIIVKLADRLHNMRTVWALKPKKARYLAQETIEVWCPICEYLGLGAVKSELEDICFAVLETDQFECVKRQLDAMLQLEEQTDEDRVCDLPCTRADCDVSRRPALAFQEEAELQPETTSTQGSIAHLSASPMTAATLGTTSSHRSTYMTSCLEPPSVSRDAAATHSALSSASPPSTAVLTPPTRTVFPAAELADRPDWSMPSFPIPGEDVLSSRDDFLSLAAPAPDRPATAHSGAPSPRDANGLAGTDSVTEDAGPAAPAPTLSPEQRRLAAALEKVVPFNANNFMSMHVEHSPRCPPPPVEFLAEASKQLMHEISVEGVAAGLRVQIQGRLKSLYSIHKKMLLKSVPLRQVYDTLALRVVVSDSGASGLDAHNAAIRACYRIRPVVNRLWKAVPAEFDDYIARPKKSGYQSIHMAVYGPKGIPMEVQIRTSSMHHHAEYGSAAHWAYKDLMKKKAKHKGSPAAPRGGKRADAPFGIAPQEGTQPAPHSGPAANAEEYAARVRIGQPIRYIVDSQPGEGVVVSVDAGARQFVAATTVGRKWNSQTGILQPLPKSLYDAMLARVNTRGWHTAGQGDSTMTLRTFKQARDGQHHLIDRFGRVDKYSELAFVDVAPPSPPRHKPPAASDAPGELSAASSSHDDGSQAVAARDAVLLAPTTNMVGRWERFQPADIQSATGIDPDAVRIDPERVVQLRASWEWGEGTNSAATLPHHKQELYNIFNAEELHARLQEKQRADRREHGGLDGGEVVDNDPRSDIAVIIYPYGIQMLPAGTTAGDLVAAMGYVDIGSAGDGDGTARTRERLVNVNNQLVPESTALASGDLVVLSDAILHNV